MPDPVANPLDHSTQPAKTISPAAKRALEEAEARRNAGAAAGPPEIGGPSGPEPTRYGDWERKGLAVDF